MKTNRQHKIVYIGFVSTLVVAIASSAIAAKYEDYVDYVVWGVFIYAALLFVAAFLMIRKENAG